MTNDPIEQIIESGLTAGGVYFERDKLVPGRTRTIDFYIPAFDLWVEVCQFHTPRKIEQLSSMPNVVLIQGRAAAVAFNHLINRLI